ncbi:hypothetical protein GIS00_25230 [Nakamurella sp. YIM 132087]|uniref:Uncharacterized protein n=1 Tax=Nakamurella alba TaxID=2665158 RepID=A0A7K1FSY2_9ACTN|nr:VOC family protein [Nakamurella alba]MTD17238.1 hypothetical protein [Nakamurella alba]
MIDGLVPFQIGTLVDDLDATMDLHRSLGVRTWVSSGRTVGHYFDADRAEVVDTGVSIALGRLGSDTCLELIATDRSGSVPWAWDPARITATSHIGYWVDDVASAGNRLIRRGARLITARVPPDAGEDFVADLVRGRLPVGLPMVYLEVGGGLLVELVSTALWSSALPAAFGEGFTAAVPAPPGAQPSVPGIAGPSRSSASTIR